MKKRNYYVMLDVNKIQNWIRSGLKIQTDFMENTEVLGIPIGCGMKMSDSLLRKKKSKLCLSLKGCQVI